MKGEREVGVMGDKQEKYIEPAVESYFFRESYKDVFFTIKRAFGMNIASIKEQAVAVGDAAYEESNMKKWFSRVLHVVALLAIAVFGTLFTVFMSALHVSILIILMLAFYVAFLVVMGIDRLILWKRKVSHVCTECQKSYLFPVYLCPSCGVEHRKLGPGRYGVLKRKCNCGMKLPTSGLKRVEGLRRSDLKALCPYCNKEDKQGESVQLVVPIGGGRSSGKSVFINAFVYDFAEYKAKELGIEADPKAKPYNKAMEKQYSVIEDLYKHGASQRTERVNDRKRSSTRDFSFWTNHASFSVPRLVHLMDIDGESFVEGTENFVPEQYKYCKGTVLIIDPFTIPEYFNEISNSLASEDADSVVHDVSIDNVLTSFVAKLRGVLKLKAGQEIKIPVAIAIGKIDVADLCDKIGEEAVRSCMAQDPEIYKEYFSTMDGLCRQFLCQYGQAAFVQQVDTEFKNVRFFAFSGMGHSLMDGAYTPKGVMPIMEWLLGQDQQMRKVWNEH